MKERRFLAGDTVEVIESGELGTVIKVFGATCHVMTGGHELFYRFAELRKVGVLNMAVDPLIKATKAAYRASDVYKLDQLLEEETRWKRKATIAQNKLADVRERINKLAKELAQPKTEPAKPKTEPATEGKKP